MDESREDSTPFTSISAPVKLSIFRTGGFGGIRIKKTATVKPEGFSANDCFTTDPFLWQLIIDLHHVLLKQQSGVIDSLPESATIPDQFSYHIALTDSSGKTVDGNFQGHRIPKVIPECFNKLPLPEK